MPIRKVAGGYKWGSHGHVYSNRAGAERQAAAAHAHGFHGDARDAESKRQEKDLLTDGKYVSGRDRAKLRTRR